MPRKIKNLLSHNTAVDAFIIHTSRLGGEKVCSNLAIRMFLLRMFHHCALEEERPSPPTNIVSFWCHLKIPADSVTLQLPHTPAHQSQPPPTSRSLIAQSCITSHSAKQHYCSCFRYTHIYIYSLIYKYIFRHILMYVQKNLLYKRKRESQFCESSCTLKSLSDMPFGKWFLFCLGVNQCLWRGIS